MEFTGILFAILLWAPFIMGEDNTYCIFDHEGGQPRAECRVNNGAAIGIIVACILVILIVLVIVVCRAKTCSWTMGCFTGCVECG